MSNQQSAGCRGSIKVMNNRPKSLDNPDMATAKHLNQKPTNNESDIKKQR
jgi:hypothetical protein